MSVRRRKGPAAVTWDEKEMERNTGMKRKSQRWVAAALAALTAASLVLPAYAVEQEPMSEAEMPKSSALPEGLTEPEQRYHFTLPYYEECTYEYETDKLEPADVQEEKQKEKSDIMLSYAAGEVVRLYVQPSDGYELNQLQLLDAKQDEVAYTWEKDGSIKTVMPESDVWLKASFIAQPEENQPLVQPVETENRMQQEASAAQVEQTENTTGQTETKPETEYVQQPETDADGLPKQGSIVTGTTIIIPFDTWEFDKYKDFRGVGYEGERYVIQYISDDIVYDVAGTYNCIYKVTDQESGKDWYVLRPVAVAEKAEEGTGIETESELTAVVETESESEPESETTLAVETEPESGSSASTETEIESETEATRETEPESEPSVVVETELEPETEPESELSAPAETELESESFTVEEPENETELQSEETELSEAGIALLSEDTPDKFKLIVNNTIYFAPASLKSGNAATTYKTIQWQDGSDSVTRTAYCIQPKLNSPGSGHTYKEDDAVELDASNGMAKGMYYLYGGPMWGKKVTYADGSGSVNLKQVLTDAGCSSTGHYYTMTHYILSYIYMNGSNWNANSGENNVLNASGVALVKKVVGILKKLDEPETHLSETTLTATNASVGADRVSGSVTYKAPEGNTATVTIPDGITLVNETSGKNGTGKVTLDGDDTFHLVVSEDYSGSMTETLTFQCKYAVDYSAYKLQLKGYQDIGFSYYSGKKSLTLTLNINDRTSEVYVQKLDAETKTAVPANENYSLAGAVYTVYTDEACTQAVLTLTTGEDGKSPVAVIQAGTYYAKETGPSKGYESDPQVYTIVAEPGQTATFTSYEQPKKKPLELQKYDKATGEAKPGSAAAGFQGAEYTLYAEASCTTVLEVLTTDASGYAKSSDLYYGMYYLKETKASYGYGLDETIYPITVSDDGQASVKVSSSEPRIKKPLELQKYDQETGEAKPGNTALSFTGAQYTIYADAALSTPVEVLMLDETGHAKSADLELGTYYVKETSPSTGYLPDETVHVVDVSDDGAASVLINSYEPVIRGSFSLMKYLDDNYDDSVLQEWIDRGELEGIRFRLQHEDASVPEVWITTDKYGYAATEENALVYGGWTLSEDASTTPDGYAGLKEAKIKIAENGVTLKYVVTNDIQDAQVRILKKDAETRKMIPLSGAQFQILDQNGDALKMPDNRDFTKVTDVFTTNEQGIISLTRALKKGSYTLKEVKAPEGYLLADGLTFEVSGKHSYLDPLEVACYDVPQKGRIQIVKLDQENGKQLGEGYTFEVSVAKEVVNADGEIRTMQVDGKETALTAGTVVAKIQTDENGVAQSPELYLGDYVVTETAAAEHYAVSGQEYPVSLMYDAQVETVTVKLEVKDAKTAVDILKVDAEEDMPLAGIHFRMFTSKELDEAGGTVDHLDKEVLQSLGTEYITDENGRIHIEDLTHDTVYYIFESETQQGYHLEQQLYKLTVDANGLIDGKASYELKISNTANNVEITKMDITGGRELPGATLTVRNAEDQVVETWVSEETPHKIKGLPAGTYTLTEERAPKGYAVAETITFTVSDSLQVQQVTMYDKEIEVAISKQDITSQKELPGAELTVADDNGNVIEKWISTEEPHMVNLPAGTYTLTEIAAPERYAKAETITFEVTDGMEVQSVVMYDKPIEVSVSKLDVTNDQELPGAKLIVKDQEGKEIESWISTEEPHKMNLAAGTYTLTEVTAPDGYEVAETVIFTVTDSMEVQTVKMYDAPKDGTTDLTGKTTTKTTGGNSGGGVTSVIAQAVKTGDVFRYLPAILLVTAGGVLMVVGIRKRKQKK